MTKLLTILLFICVFYSCRINKKEKKENELSAIKQFSSPAKDSAAEPYLFTDSKGSVYLSWIEKNGPSSFFKFSILEQEIKFGFVMIIWGDG